MTISRKITELTEQLQQELNRIEEEATTALNLVQEKLQNDANNFTLLST